MMHDEPTATLLIRDLGGSGVVQLVLTREAVMDPEAIRVLIRAKLQDGRLPRRSATRVFSAPGTGELCGACEQLLAGTQLAMVVPLKADNTFVKLHADCYLLWVAERDGGMSAQRP